MLKLISFLIKLSIFSVVVLAVGNRLKIGNQTVSDKVNTQLAHAERSELAGKVRRLAGQLKEDASEGFRNKVRSNEDLEKIVSSEREKLRALIRELNSSSSE